MCEILYLFLLLSPQVQWQTTDTGVYRPLVFREVAVTPNGEVFICKREEAQIVKFGSDGKKVRVFAAKGKGPGELGVPTWLHLQGDRLCVEDAALLRVSVFSLAGDFIEMWRLPTSEVQLAKTQGGWLVGEWESKSNRNSSLAFADQRLENLEPLIVWERPESTNSVSAQSTGSGVTAIPLNPAPENAFLAASADGKRGFLIQQSSDDLHIIDTITRKVIKVVENELKPLPFNKAWGEERLARAREQMIPEQIRHLFEIKANFPDYFPIVRAMRVLPQGTVALSLWSGDPNKAAPVLFYNQSGEKIDAPFSAEAVPRILGQHGDWIYLSVYDAEEEEGRVARVPLGAVNNFVAKNPNRYDGLPGDVVSIAN